MCLHIFGQRNSPALDASCVISVIAVIIAADSSIELLAVANADADSFKPAPTSAAVTANLFVLLLSAFAY